MTPSKMYPNLKKVTCIKLSLKKVNNWMGMYRNSYSILRVLLSQETRDTRDAFSYLTKRCFSPSTYLKNINENILKFSSAIKKSNKVTWKKSMELWLKWVWEGGKSVTFLQKSMLKLFSGSQLRYMKTSETLPRTAVLCMSFLPALVFSQCS